MIQIPEPPDVAACSTCAKPLSWHYSARTSRWVAFVPAPNGAVSEHGCRERPSLRPFASWREVRRGTPPNETYRAVRQQLKERTEKETT